MDGKRSMRDILDMVNRDIKENGLDILAPKGRKYPNNLAKPRIYEVSAALNRLRTLETMKY